MNQDDQVFAPYTTVMKKLSGQQYLNRIYASARSRPTSSTAAAAAVDRDAARRSTASSRATPDDFTVQTPGRHRRAAHADGAAR